MAFCHREALLGSVKASSHFLHDLMELCMKSILSGRWEDAWSALNDNLLSRLKALVLISSWERCFDDVTAMNVMQAAKMWDEHDCDSVVIEACKRFKLNASLTELFISYYQDLHSEANFSEVRNKTRSIFCQLQTQSTLSVIHSIFGLKNISSDKVLELLNSTQGNKLEVRDSPVFCLCDEAIYSGYLAMSSIMKAIYLSCEYKHIILAKKVNMLDILYQTTDSLNLSDYIEKHNMESLAECVNNHGPQYAYSKFIVEKLEKSKKEIKKIFPIAFRVEILENIFSMLFLMSHNLTDSMEPCSDSDQGHEGESSLMTTHNESFSVMNGNSHSTEPEKRFSGRFVISTVKLKDFKEVKSDFSESHSGHISSKSTESNSSSAFQPYTFLCNELISRDLLTLLKDAVLEAKAEVYTAIGQTEATLKNKDNHENLEHSRATTGDTANCVMSINSAELPERTSQLLQYVNEAIWRYEVVKSDILQEPSQMSSLRIEKPHLFQSQRSASSSDGTDKENKKRRKKRKYKRSFSGHKKDSFAESSIIQCMLSSPEALLRYSLWSRNLKQALQVIQLFHLETSNEAKEVALMQELQRVARKLAGNEKIKAKPIKKDSVYVGEGNALISNILAIEDAAASGLRSSEICLIIHHELSSLNIPEIVDITGGVRHPELMLGSENIYSIFLADLSYISRASLDLSSTLLDMSTRSWSSSKAVIHELDAKILSRKKMPLIRGNHKTLLMINSLLKEFLNFFDATDFRNDLKCLFWPINKDYKSFSSILSNFVGSLDCQRFKDELNNWKTTATLLEDFCVLLVEEEANEKCKVLLKDIKRENKLHMTYKKLSKSLRELRDWSSETIRPQPVHYENYLSKLLIHLHQVTTAALDCKKQSINTDPVVYSSDFSILKVSPVELLKKIILQSGITPEKIEQFAIRMKVDLVHVIAEACLPQVPLSGKNVSPQKTLMAECCVTSNDYPLLILNLKKEEWPSPRHPDLAARELLKHLTSMMQDTTIANDSSGILTEEELNSLVNHSDLHKWMEDCSELAFVDLDLLETREEKLAFFVNVTNIACIHAILMEFIAIKSQDRENESLSSDLRLPHVLNKSSSSYGLLSSLNHSERLAMQKVFGYQIGQLGPVSLFDMRYQLLHAQLPVPKHLQEPPFNHLLDDPKPIWEKYMPPVEQRVLFVLVEGLLYSPKLQLLYSEVIDDQLEEAMKNYFDFTIHIDKENRVVSLPKLLEWYALDFAKEDESDLDSAPYEGLLNLLATLTSPHQAELFQALFSEESSSFSENIDSTGKKQLPCSLEFKTPLESFGILLNYSTPYSAISNIKCTEPALLMNPQPVVLKYLNDKCEILSHLYVIFRNEKVAPQVSEQSTVEYTQNTWPIPDSLPKVPVIYLLTYYKNLLTVTDDIYSWFSSALSHSPDREFFSQQIEACFSKKEWNKALLYIDIYLEHFENDWTYLLIKRLVLEHVASISNIAYSIEPFSYALRINNPLYRANTVLQNIYKWSDHSAVQALKFCLSSTTLTEYPDVCKSLQNKMREVILYKKIFDASEMYGDSEAKDCVYVFNNWQEVSDCSVWDQSRILNFIKCSGKYEFAVEWAELHVVNKEQQMLALSMQIIWLLTQNPTQEQKVIQLLDALEDSSDFISLFEMVLPELPTIEAKLCLVQYIISNNISCDNQHYYFNMLLGLKMLSALKSPNKDIYEDLIAHPYLLLEQMLMNVEMKDAEEALKAVHEDLQLYSDVGPVMSLSSVDQLVEDYASKALEVHFLDALLDDSSSSTIVISTEETLVSEEVFVIPLHVPTKEEWVPDAKIQRCQVCKEERFNMFSRRHHCRRCGRVVCANCSQHALLIEGYGNVKVRICDDCYNVMTGSVSLTTASFEKRYRTLSSMQSSSPRNSPFQLEHLGLRRRTGSIHSGHQSFRWLLCPDSEQNASVRNEFSYEQAPSISLCYSILKLHNNQRKCAQFMLNLCDRLLGKIKPRRSGKISLEIDYSLIISMIKSLLMNVKVKCHQVQDSEGEALADLYFQHLDVMKLLVNANCRHLLPRDSVINVDASRKLRDKLLEEERMNLALEVSTKFNLEKAGVWSSWGLFCLRAGDWLTARVKFQQCLKKLNDKNDQTQENPLLKKILTVLENSKYPGRLSGYNSKYPEEKASAIVKSLSALENIKGGLTQLKSEITPLNELIKNECLFYLHTYGTHFSVVQFYHKHGLMDEALEYILEKKCAPEVFIEAIFMPVLKNIQLSSLKLLLTSTDPSLSKWCHYLFATCRYLERMKFLNVLYEMQIFMEDYVRAAKSAINFYLAPATSYKDLFDRHRYLHSAKKHYEKYLSDCKRTDLINDMRKKKVLKTLPVKEVESCLQIINLQEKVASFFQLCESQSKNGFFEDIGSLDKERNKSYCPPTLFDNSSKKAEVALVVLLNAVNIDEGFDLAIRIIETFNLDATDLLCKAGRELVQMNQKQQIPHFLACVKCMFAKFVKVDEVILECVSAVSKQGGDVEDIVKMITSDSNKIHAYLMCGKLKSAYLLAIKLNSALDVRRVMVAAEQRGQDSIQRFCRKWLETNSLKLKVKEPGF